MKSLIRPPWIELWKLQKKSDFDAAAARLFGNQPKKEGEKLKPYTAEEYFNRFGVKIMDYRNFYAEVGSADAPVGPCTPATDRLSIWPIMAIRQTRSGAWTVHGLKLTKGFFSRDKNRAWVNVDDYEDLLGDSFFEKILDDSERIKQAAARHGSSQRKVTVHPVGDSRDLTPEERRIIEEVLVKKQS